MPAISQWQKPAKALQHGIDFRGTKEPVVLISMHLATKQPRGTQLTHNACKHFEEVSTRLGRFQPTGNILRKIFHNVSVIYMFSIVPHKT